MAKNRLSLNAVAAFEAAARHRNFTRAAEELGVLQPAVSRHVRQLEMDLGAQLFERGNRRMNLTDAGQTLYTGALEGLASIDAAVAEIRREAALGKLTVNASIGFSSCWLIARLADFHRRHPEIDLRLITRDSHHQFDVNEADVNIRFGDGSWDYPSMRLIFSERLFAVCAPAYAAAHPVPAQLSEWPKQKLLIYDEQAHVNDWAKLFNGSGVTLPAPSSECLFNSFIVYLHAIVEGRGLGVGWAGLMQDHIESGRLQAYGALSRVSGLGYYCHLSPRALKNKYARIFCDWLVLQGKSAQTDSP